MSWLEFGGTLLIFLARHLAYSTPRGNVKQIHRESIAVDLCQSWVSEGSFADRSGLVEVNVARATSGEGLRPQLDRVRRQVGINGAAVEVSG